MTTIKQLSKSYDVLTANERAALCIRALARNDNEEFQRLCDAARRIYWKGPDHGPIVKAISVLSISYLSEQLGNALLYWFSVGQTVLDTLDNRVDDPTADADSNR